MTKKNLADLSKRERQIMEIIILKNEITAQDLEDQMPKKLSNSTIRTLLRILVDKKMLRIEKIGSKYLYKPTFKKEDAQKSAFKNLLKTFFSGSAYSAVTSLISSNNNEFSEQELNHLEELIQEAKQKRGNLL
jgi:BlaI family transcriptional regulator, penicillinase repressor